jgi:hypothetical protein
VRRWRASPEGVLRQQRRLGRLRERVRARVEAVARRMVLGHEQRVE